MRDSIKPREVIKDMLYFFICSDLVVTLLLIQLCAFCELNQEFNHFVCRISCCLSVTPLRCNWCNDGFWNVWLVSEVGLMSWITINTWFWKWCQETKRWNSELKKCGRKPDSSWCERMRSLKMFLEESWKSGIHSLYLYFQPNSTVDN